MLGFFKKLFGKAEENGPQFDKDGKPVRRDVRGEITVDYEQVEREDPVYYTVKGRKTVKLNVGADIKDGETVRFRDFDGYGSDLYLKINLTGRKKAAVDPTQEFLKRR